MALDADGAHGVVRQPTRLLVAAVVLAALNLRTAVTSVGPLLSEIQRDVGLSGVQTAVLTALPVACFAVIGWLTPRASARLGHGALLTTGLWFMTVGLVVRASTSSAPLFLAASVLALSGGAIGNVLLPAVVRQRFAGHIGRMTAAYTTALAVGSTVAAAATAPLASVAGAHDWRHGLGLWAVLSVGTGALWLYVLRTDGLRGGSLRRTSRVGISVRASPTAWALALFFGAQSMQAFVGFGWYAEYYRDRGGFTASSAGLLVALTTALLIPLSLVVPVVAARRASQRALVVTFAACYVAAYLGMLVAPRAGALLWALLAGLGGGAFPLSLTLITLRTRTASGTAALSGFAQSVGYVLAASGPLLVGVLHSATGGWAAPFALLFGSIGLMGASGWCAARPMFIEDELHRQVA